jgi:signal transduction histidine kinase
MVRSFLSYFAFLVASCGTFALVACSPARDASGAASAGVSLSDRIELLEDPLGTTTLEQVVSSPLSESFERRQGPLNLGLTSSFYWLRIRLGSADFAGGDGPWIATMGQYLERVDAYATGDPAARGPWISLHHADLLQENTASSAYALPVSEPPPAWLLFHAQSLDTFFISPRVVQVRDYVADLSSASLRRGIYYGVMIGTIIYNFFLAIWLRDRAYALYVVFEALFCLAITGMDRTLVTLVPAALPALRFGLTEQLIGLAGIAAVFFARDFLDLRGSVGVRWMVRGATLTSGLIVVLPFALGRQALSFVVHVFTISAPFVILFMALYAWRRGNKQAPLFVFAWATVLTVVVVGSLKNLGVVMPVFDVMDCVRVGSGTEAMLLALALARRMRLTRLAEENARSELAEARLGLSKALRQKIVALNTLVGGVAHEIGNPLNFAAGGAKDAVIRLEKAEALTTDLSRPLSANEEASLRQLLASARRSAALAARGTERIDGIVRSLRAYIGNGAKPAEPTDLDECIRGTMTLLDDYLRSKNIEVILELQLRTQIRCCPAEMNQVFMNLALNACQAMPEGGKLVISSKEGEDVVRIVVCDTGQGIPSSHRQAIFDPFFTTRAPNEGTGLGLSVSLEIVRRHGGALELLPSTDHEPGAKFSITLPRS